VALQKNIITKYGVTANYFKISGIEINSILNTANIKLNGYYNEAARLDDSKSLMVLEYRVVENSFTTYFSTEVLNVADVNIYTTSYKYIKENEEKFIDAIEA
jgi:hypothetical protein